MPGGPGGASATPTGKNLILKFEKSNITGVITASTARHTKDTLTSADYLLVSEVKNTPGAAVNNGVVVALSNSTWTVTGTCYLTSLTIGDGSAVATPKGKKVTMTVDGVAKPIKAGQYKGAIVLSVN
jgi:flagellar basal body rod protein FlgF